MREREREERRRREVERDRARAAGGEEVGVTAGGLALLGLEEDELEGNQGVSKNRRSVV